MGGNADVEDGRPSVSVKIMVAPGAKPSVRVLTNTSVIVVSHSWHDSPLIRVVPLGPKLSIKVEVTSSVIVLSLVQEVVDSVSLAGTDPVPVLPVPTAVAFGAASANGQLFSAVEGMKDGSYV